MQMKLKILLVVCALLVVACSADGEQSELVTAQAAAAEVVDPPDVSALGDDSDERQPEVKAPESEVDAEASEMEAAIDDLKAAMAELAAVVGEWDENQVDPMMIACGAETVLADFLDAFTASSVVIDSALGTEDPLVVEYYAAIVASSGYSSSGYYIPTEADMARIYAAIGALAADERTADVDWTAVRSAYAAIEEVDYCVAEGIPVAASLLSQETLCRAAGYEWTNPDTTTGNFCTE